MWETRLYVYNRRGQWWHWDERHVWGPPRPLSPIIGHTAHCCEHLLNSLQLPSPSSCSQPTMLALNIYMVSFRRLMPSTNTGVCNEPHLPARRLASLWFTGECHQLLDNRSAIRLQAEGIVAVFAAQIASRQSGEHLAPDPSLWSQHRWLI